MRIPFLTSRIEARRAELQRLERERIDWLERERLAKKEAKRLDTKRVRLWWLGMGALSVIVGGAFMAAVLKAPTKQAEVPLAAPRLMSPAPAPIIIRPQTPTDPVSAAETMRHSPEPRPTIVHEAKPKPPFETCGPGTVWVRGHQWKGRHVGGYCRDAPSKRTRHKRDELGTHARAEKPRDAPSKRTHHKRGATIEGVK